MAKPEAEDLNETDVELDWQDGFHWKTGASQWQPGDPVL